VPSPSFRATSIHNDYRSTILDPQGMPSATAITAPAPDCDDWGVAAKNATRLAPSLLQCRGHRRPRRGAWTRSGEVWVTRSMRDLYQE